ncbi:hypothetical protein [Brevirhabdus sp.]|uniref:hypothetical protein n=1 Tax=Brevirhabdus sp. TaxID=2004514 RepID=UPI00405A3D7F
MLLLTDPCGSPIAKVARHSFSCGIEMASAWDSNVATMVLLEALVASVRARIWPETSVRMTALEGLFDMTNLFRQG